MSVYAVNSSNYSIQTTITYAFLMFFVPATCSDVNWHAEYRASWYTPTIKPTRCTQALKSTFGTELYMFRTVSLSIIRSLALCFRHFRFKSWYIPAIQIQTASSICLFNVRFGSSDLNHLPMRFSLLKNLFGQWSFAKFELQPIELRVT